MLERSYQTRQGTIRYWVSAPGPRGTALVFLPGLTADHRLFQMQFSFLHPAGPCWCGTHRATGPPAHLPGFLPDGTGRVAPRDLGSGEDGRACIDRSVHGGVSGAVLYGAIPRTGPGIYLH